MKTLKVKTREGFKAVVSNFDFKSLSFLMKLNCPMKICFYRDDKIVDYIYIKFTDFGRRLNKETKQLKKYPIYTIVRPVLQRLNDGTLLAPIRKGKKTIQKKIFEFDYDGLIKTVASIEHDDVKIVFDWHDYNRYKIVIEYAEKVDNSYYTDKFKLLDRNDNEEYYGLIYSPDNGKPNKVYLYDNNSMLIFNKDGFALLAPGNHDFKSIYDILK